MPMATLVAGVTAATPCLDTSVSAIVTTATDASASAAPSPAAPGP
jgi:hypothetical protein